MTDDLYKSNAERIIDQMAGEFPELNVLLADRPLIRDRWIEILAEEINDW